MACVIDYLKESSLLLLFEESSLLLLFEESSLLLLLSLAESSFAIEVSSLLVFADASAPACDGLFSFTLLEEAWLLKGSELSVCTPELALLVSLSTELLFHPEMLAVQHLLCCLQRK